MWLGLARSTVAEAAAHSGGDILALSISSQGHSWAPVDENGAPLRPAITWLDTRSRGFADSIRDEMPQLPATVGKDPAPWHVLPQWLWLRENEPQVAEAARGLRMAMDMVVEDMAGAAVYLASRAGDYVVGDTIVVDGGVTLARGS